MVGSVVLVIEFFKTKTFSFLQVVSIDPVDKKPRPNIRVCCAMS